MIVIIWSVVTFLALYLYFRRIYSRFSAHGVRHFPVIPPLGNMLPIMLRKEHVAYNIDRMYKKFSNDRFIGRYEFINPSIVIRDLKLIKKITIKDFDNFVDHRDFTDETIDPLFGRNLFSLRGQEWKEMRTFLSPTFTSSKIKLMVPFIEDVGRQMIESLKNKLTASQSNYIEVDAKDLSTRSTNDVIASCAFGLKVDSHKDPNNHFYKMGKTTTAFTLRQFILYFAYAAFPSIFRKLKLTLLSKETNNFFIDLVLNTMKDRESRNIIRPDMIHLLMEAKKGALRDDEGEGNTKGDFATFQKSFVTKKNVNKAWSDVDLVAQAVIFLVAGFETVSTALTFTMYELAIHPEVQDKLYQEIMDFDAKHNGKLDYSSLQNLTYLDMVVSEVLRFWPPLTILDRECIKSYNLGKPNNEAIDDFVVYKGEIVIIPVWSLHHDAELFPEPEKFDPERFSEENRHLINPLAYMPFGIGPRNCIASRFAQLEVKVLLYYILKNMELSPSKNTVHPARMSARNFNPRFENGHWIRFSARK